MKDLEELTLKILKSTGKFTSNDFIKSYNIIYLHCTEKTPTYEIKGREIYDLLHSVLVKYFKSLRPISSLLGFYELSVKLEKSFVLLERVYFYIERFFINVNSKKRGSNVVHLRTLFFDLLYKHFMYDCMANLEEYFIHEIGLLRANADEESFRILVESISYLRNLFFYSENEVEYEHFLEMYFNSFNAILAGDDIVSMIRKINSELETAKKLFEFSNRESYYELTKGISKNFRKFLEWFFKNRRNQDVKFLKNYKRIEKILYYLDGKYVDQFFIKLEPNILEYLNSLNTIEDLSTFFLEFKDTFNLGNGKTDTLEIKVENEIIAKIRNKENVPNFFSKLISECIKTKVECDSKINYIYYLINLIYQKKSILKRLSQDCLERIINDSSGIKLEQKFVKICENYCGASSVSWLKLILKAYDSAAPQNFGLSDQDFDFETKLRLITKGFCNLDITSTVLHPKLANLKDILIKRNSLQYPRSDIMCCYRASSIVIEINGLDIEISTDKASILLYIAEQQDLEFIKSECKDPNFEENIEFLNKHKLIFVDEGKAVINEDTAEILELHGKSIISSNSINIFKYEIKARTKIISKIENANLLESALESNIMKLMKRLKNSTKTQINEEILKIFGSKINDLESVYEKLATKGYINVNNGNIVYIP